MTTGSITSAGAAQRSTAMILLLALVGLPIDGMLWQVSFGHAPPLHLVGIVVAVVLLLLLLGIWKQPPVWLSITIALLNTVVVLAALWSASDALARGSRQWIPFQSHKLGVFAIALLAPVPAWLGVVLIALFTAAPVCEYALFSPELRAHLAFGEPWATIAFGAFALVVLVDRRRRARVEADAAIAHAEAETLNHVARVSLAVRDLSNTPLQTIRIGAALLKTRHPEEEPAIDRIERAVCRLEELSRALARYEATVEWPAEAESFDAIAVVEGRAERRKVDPDARSIRS